METGTKSSRRKNLAAGLTICPQTPSVARHYGKIQTSGPLSALLGICLLTLSGCTTFSRTADATWTTEGRLAGQHHHDGFSANFFYAQTKQGFDLQLLGPLGMHPIRVVQTPHIVTAYFEGQTYEARDAEALVYELTGWELPVHFLNHWLQGKPAPTPKVSHLKRNSTGKLVHFVQAGWQVDLSYQHNHLHKMTLTNPPWRLKLLLHPPD